jgi:hypothetical protein
MTDYQILKQKSAALNYLAEIFLLDDWFYEAWVTGECITRHWWCVSLGIATIPPAAVRSKYDQWIKRQRDSFLHNWYWNGYTTFSHSYRGSWYYQSFIYSSTDALVSCLEKTILKFTLKPSSGSTLMCSLMMV